MKKIVLVTLLLVLMFVTLLLNYNDRFEQIDIKYKARPVGAVNLAKGVNPDDIASVLQVNNYILGKVDIDVVSKFIAEKLEAGAPLPALYNLNKRAWQIPASLIDSIANASELKKNGSKKEESYLVAKWRNSLESLGIDSVFAKVDTAQLKSEVTVHNKEYNGRITVTITKEAESAGLLNKLFGGGGEKCAGVVVRLSEQYLDSLNVSQRETLCFAKTNAKGVAVFEGLDPAHSYSVIPISKGCEYGSSKGTIGGGLSKYENESLECSFVQKEHKIRIFDAITLKRIKEDATMTVRSPEKFKEKLSACVVLFFISWWSLWFFCYLRKKRINSTILSILMALTGLCLLTMFSINDPLTDTLLGIDMAYGIIFGVIFITILQNVNFKELYQNRLGVSFDVPLEILLWVFKPFRRKVSYLTGILSNRSSNSIKKLLALLGVVACLPFLLLDLLKVTNFYDALCRLLNKLPKGCGYLLFAIFLTMLLFTPLGAEVGGMKVNLNVGILFQPSEIAKYLIIFFMAAYFCVNANRIVQYSEEGNAGLFMAKIKMLTFVIMGLGFLMLVYLVLGDMGPALILAFTFIILYSLIKSKINLQGLTLDKQLQKIFTCDFAMLIYGIFSFAIFLYIGNKIGSMGVFCFLWFAVWIVGGIIRKQIFETAIFFNFIVSAFIFGGTILGSISGLDSVAKRLDSRTRMCTNTWGTLPLNGEGADAGENTQVVEGLWALASGGMWGQGLGDGTPHFIPAFHTDMILESIGEQTGFVGIFVVILLLALLLRNTIVLGYRTSHPFVFYLCLGIAIVTAIQFVVISLGSTGIIPLTGVTVPFFSYGKVSMILNLVAFGVVLSISTNNITEAENESAMLTKQNIEKYNYSVSLLSWAYSALALFIAWVFYFYQVIDRDDTLIKPVYLNNTNGIPIVEYNPRIMQLTNKLYAGDIYDRNGLLLATSDKSKFRNSSPTTKVAQELRLKLDTLKLQDRYYPFGEHLYFMLGDYNSKLYSSSDASSQFPRGYMAEFYHITDLRGYDNKMRDKRTGKPVTVDLYSNKYNPDKYHSDKYEISYKDYQIRDYSALVPYLKAGLHSEKVKRLNERKRGDIEPKDIQLTIDAELQAKLQSYINEYVNRKHSHLNKLRVSVVILDGKNGDLLTSAVYPLPNYDILKDNEVSYNDMNRDWSWKAYTDMDLGLTFPTAPGSTAKVVTGLAGYKKEGDKIESAKYYIYPQERIFPGEPVGMVVDMNLAFRKSSNCYFVNLLNDKDLFDDLAITYATLGITIDGVKSYTLNYNEPSLGWLSRVTSARGESMRRYERYKAAGKWDKMSKNKPHAWGWSWGQYGITATPLAMARAASVIVNDGVMPVTRYTLHDEVKNVELLSSTKILKKHLKDTRASHESGRSFSKCEYIGGKTGTPERTSSTKRIRTKRGKYITVEKGRQNDGWYICFIENATIKSTRLNQLPRKQDKDLASTSTTAPLAIAIRMERLGKGEMSGNATRLMDEIVIKALTECGYMK